MLQRMMPLSLQTLSSILDSDNRNRVLRKKPASNLTKPTANEEHTNLLEV